VKFQRIVEAVYFQPWSITREGWQSVHSILKPHLEGGFDPAKLRAEMRPDGSWDETTDFFGNPIPQYHVDGDTAYIPIRGVLLHHADLMEKQCGAWSYDDIRRHLRLAATTPGVRRAVLDINSPGGMALGADETAMAVADCAKVIRIEAVTDSQMCSAAYQIAVPCHSIACTPSAQVGCIGCFLPWIDERLRFELAGLSVQLFADGKFKGAGTPGTSLTLEQQNYFQSIVNKYGGEFKRQVAQNRVVDDTAMEGQVFIGSDALRAGMVDEVITELEDHFPRLEDEAD
jgi:ClpP class serine protease